MTECKKCAILQSKIDKFEKKIKLLERIINERDYAEKIVENKDLRQKNLFPRETS